MFACSLQKPISSFTSIQKDLLKYENIRSRYDSTEIRDFRQNVATIFKTRPDTVWMWEVMGDYYLFKDTMNIVYTDSISSDIFNDLLFDLLKSKKAALISKKKSGYLLLKTRYVFPFVAKYSLIYDPENKKKSLVIKEIRRRRLRHDGF